MRHSKVVSLKETLRNRLKQWNQEVRKSDWRSFKKYYNSIPRKLRNEF